MLHVSEGLLVLGEGVASPSLTGGAPFPTYLSSTAADLMSTMAPVVPSSTLIPSRSRAVSSVSEGLLVLMVVGSPYPSGWISSPMFRDCGFVFHDGACGSIVRDDFFEVPRYSPSLLSLYHDPNMPVLSKRSNRERSNHLRGPKNQVGFIGSRSGRGYSLVVVRLSPSSILWRSV